MWLKQQMKLENYMSAKILKVGKSKQEREKG